MSNKILAYKHILYDNIRADKFSPRSQFYAGIQSYFFGEPFNHSSWKYGIDRAFKMGWSFGHWFDENKQAGKI